MRKSIFLFGILMMVLLLTACGGSAEQTSPVTADPDMVENMVNATLTAMAPLPTFTPTPTFEPSSTPEPTSMPTEIPATATLVAIEGDPAAILGEPDGTDNFDTFNNWSLFENNCFKSEITDMSFFPATGESIAHLHCALERRMLTVEDDDNGVAWWRQA